MGGFVTTALGLPAVLFTFSFVLVIGYWLIILLFGAAAEAVHADGDAADAHAGAASLGGLPVSVAVSFLIALSWIAAMLATRLLGQADTAGAARAGLAVGAGAASLAVGWAAMLLLARPLRRILPDGRAASRRDFVGGLCTVRTGTVTDDFGQAEIVAEDGSSALVQVRQFPSPGEAQLRAGDIALVFDYDETGEFFRVTPFDRPGLGRDHDPGSPAR